MTEPMPYRPARAALAGMAGLLACGLAGCDPAPDIAAEAAAEAPPQVPTEQATSPRNPLRNAYFGDLHLHTRNSYDAYLFNVRATPEDAYRYAKGGTIQHAAGFDLKLNSGPLDFLAVTDHAEYLGVLEAIDTPGTSYSEVPYADDLVSTERAEVLAAFGRFVDSLLSGERLPELSDMSATRSAWGETIRSAQRHNDPGSFTSFVGYEFTSLPEIRNLHRNVIFAGGDVPGMPYSALDSQNPEDLWRWLDERRAEGMDALAIPHNSNASDGTMFERVMWNGEPIDRTYAELRARNEPLAEILQIKGQSETMPLLSPNDEWAGFEVMTSYIGSREKVTNFGGGYLRDALKRGLQIEKAVGANPYRLGFAAGSDSHNAGGAFEEDNYSSKVGVLDAFPEQRGSVPPPEYGSWEAYEVAGETLPTSSAWGSAGLTGVWAEENTRPALFAAMRRREVFATSGPRILVRLFAGYRLEGADLATEDGLRAAYDRGVPMGGELPARRDAEPGFAIVAQRDPHGAPLQRVQIVKGWIDGEGEAFERVYDAGCADGGTVDPATHRCPNNGAGVDLSTCAVPQDKGDAQIQAFWTDPDFNPAQNAFYYARVLQNPTCRWSTWDAIRAGVAPNPALAATIQERAYTSPIWIDAVDAER